MNERTGPTYAARKELFAKGLKSGRLSVREIEEGLSSLGAAERWLFYYSLKAAEVEIVESVRPETERSLNPGR